MSGALILHRDKDPAQALSLADRSVLPLAGARSGARAPWAIVLSGTGSDGSRGIRDVQRRRRPGALPRAGTSAQFDGMPLSAPGHRRRRPRARAAAPSRASCAGCRRSGRSTEDAEPLERRSRRRTPRSDSCAIEYGIDFSHYKTSTVARRIERRVDLSAAGEHRRRTSSSCAGRPRRAERRCTSDLLIGVTQLLPRSGGRSRVLERERDPGSSSTPRPAERGAPAVGRRLRHRRGGLLAGDPAPRGARGARQRPSTVKIFATDVHRAVARVRERGHLPRAAARAPSSAGAARALLHAAVERLPGLARSCASSSCSRGTTCIKDAPFTKPALHLVPQHAHLPPAARRRGTVLSLFHFGLALGRDAVPGPEREPRRARRRVRRRSTSTGRSIRKRRDVQPRSPQLRLPLNRRAVRPARPSPVELPRTHAADPLILATYDQLLDQLHAAELPGRRGAAAWSTASAARSGCSQVRRRRHVERHPRSARRTSSRTVVAGADPARAKEQARVQATRGVADPGRGGRRAALHGWIRPSPPDAPGRGTSWRARHVLDRRSSTPAASSAPRIGPRRRSR